MTRPAVRQRLIFFMPLGTTLGGWHATFDEPQGMYCKFQLSNDVDHYGRLLNVFMCYSSFSEEMALELQHVVSMQKSQGPGFILAEPGRGGRPANELDWIRISCTWGWVSSLRLQSQTCSLYCNWKSAA